LDEPLPAKGYRLAGCVTRARSLATGGYGDVIQDALNSNQTPTMATFAPGRIVLLVNIADRRNDCR
jgi:hypothetical protein